jgi:hypothetical protein
VLYLLIVAHAVMDYLLQPDAMALEKDRHSATPLQKAVPWYYWLTAHALGHGGAVYFVTNSLFLALLETLVHWFIDFAKCEKWTSIAADQALHVGCKVVWWLLLIYGMTAPVDDVLRRILG